MKYTLNIFVIKLIFLVIVFSEICHAFIYFEDSGQKGSLIQKTSAKSGTSTLIQSLERITCEALELQNGYLQTKEMHFPSLMYASLNRFYQTTHVQNNDSLCSVTARDLLLDAIKSSRLYRVRENNKADLGRVASLTHIELNYNDVEGIKYRGVPRQTFDIGMIFLHEIVHRHYGLTDPTKDEIKTNSFLKGKTVEFMNRIERELGLPQRRHYAALKIRYIHNKPRWGIYFGESAGHVELDPGFGLR